MSSMVPSDHPLSLDSPAGQSELVRQINNEYREAEIARKTTIVLWARIGAKLKVLHDQHGRRRGGWESFVSSNFNFSLPAARKMQQLAERYPELADPEKDVDQVLPEFVAARPELAPAVERGINAVLANGREPRQRPGTHPRVGPSNGQATADVLDETRPESARPEVEDVVGLLVSMMPEQLRRLSQNPEAFAQMYFADHSENPPNPRVFSIFCSGAAAILTTRRMHNTERDGHARRARRSADDVLVDALAAAPEPSDG